MTTPTPDQPTGMNELRPILLAVRDWGEGLAQQQFDDDPLAGMSPTDAEAAIQQIVERCLPEKIGHKGWCDLLSTRSYINKEDVSCSCDSSAQYQAIDQFRHNLQQAGLLRGDELTQKPAEETEAQ